MFPWGGGEAVLGFPNPARTLVSMPLGTFRISEENRYVFFFFFFFFGAAGFFGAVGELAALRFLGAAVSSAGSSRLAVFHSRWWMS